LPDLLEDGHVLLFPHLEFALCASEQQLLAPSVSDGHAKNISFDPHSGRIAGSALVGTELEALRTMMGRFTGECTEFLQQMLPAYAEGLRAQLASFRPLEIEGRQVSKRKNDMRLHVDAFASRPNRGQRILRVFSNINTHGKPRTWLLGEPFEIYARRLLPHVRRQLPLEAALLHRLHITKELRSRYDHLMLQLHDHGKLSESYQSTAPRERIDFPPGSTWMCFTDQVLHGATGGQHLLEQTFLLPLSALRHPERSPLRRLEALTGRSLV
jgi:hypothetical protein